MLPAGARVADGFGIGWVHQAAGWAEVSARGRRHSTRSDIDASARPTGTICRCGGCGEGRAGTERAFRRGVLPLSGQAFGYSGISAGRPC